MSIDLTFIIPVIHPNACRSWRSVLDRLQETLDSIHNAVKENDNFRIALVINKGAPISSLRLSKILNLIEVELPPPAVSVYKGEADEQERMGALTYDKGYKVGVGANWARSVGSRFIMSVDADDLISERLPDVLNGGSPGAGWYINKGWILDYSSLWTILVTDFHNWCGTFSIVRTDLLPTDKPIESISPDFIREIYGNHRMLIPHMKALGHELKPINFPAAAYVIGHSEGTYCRQSFLWRSLRVKKLLQSPKAYIRTLLRIRFFWAGMRQQFGFVKAERD